MTTVVNVRYTLDLDASDVVYIGRSMRFISAYGRTFRNIGWGNQSKALAEYEARVRASPDLMARLPELAGKRLACWCAPKEGFALGYTGPLRCHGQVLLRLLAELEGAPPPCASSPSQLPLPL